MKAIAKGTVSDMPIVRGLGPREAPTGMEVVSKVTALLLSDLDMNVEGLFLPVALLGICTIY